MLSEQIADTLINCYQQVYNDISNYEWQEIAKQNNVVSNYVPTRPENIEKFWDNIQKFFNDFGESEELESEPSESMEELESESESESMEELESTEEESESDSEYYQELKDIINDMVIECAPRDSSISDDQTQEVLHNDYSFGISTLKQVFLLKPEERSHMTIEINRWLHTYPVMNDFFQKMVSEDLFDNVIIFKENLFKMIETFIEEYSSDFLYIKGVEYAFHLTCILMEAYYTYMLNFFESDYSEEYEVEF